MIGPFAPQNRLLFATIYWSVNAGYSKKPKNVVAIKTRRAKFESLNI